MFTLPGVPDPPLAQLSQVGFTASRLVILRDLNLTITAGDVVGVSGPNGSGKTTLVRLLATLLRPTSGTYTVLGSTIGSPSDVALRARTNIAMIGHTPAVWPELTLRENVEIIEGLNGGNGNEDPLELVGLAGAADRRADRASQGMQRRVEFARLLRRTPRLLLLDEAHAGLDADAAAIVEEVVRRVTARGGAALLVSHEPARIEGMITRWAALDDGTLVELGR